MIRYRAGFKYQLVGDHTFVVPEFAGFLVEHPYFTIVGEKLTVRDGYAWDGLTGALDNSASLGASLVHDVACQAVGEGLAPFALRTPHADAAFYRIMVENGTPRIVAAYRWAAVDCYARAHGPGEPKPVREAP